MQSLALSTAASSASGRGGRGGQRTARPAPRRPRAPRPRPPRRRVRRGRACPAHRCLTAWNEPIGRPNCCRVRAYSVAVWLHQAGDAGGLGRAQHGGQVTHLRGAQPGQDLAGRDDHAGRAGRRPASGRSPPASAAPAATPGWPAASRNQRRRPRARWPRRAAGATCSPHPSTGADLAAHPQRPVRRARAGQAGAGDRRDAPPRLLAGGQRGQQLLRRGPVRPAWPATSAGEQRRQHRAGHERVGRAAPARRPGRPTVPPAPPRRGRHARSRRCRGSARLGPAAPPPRRSARWPPGSRTGGEPGSRPRTSARSISPLRPLAGPTPASASCSGR